MKDINNLSQSLDTILNMSSADRQKSLRWLARQNDIVLYDIFRLQKLHFHRLKSQNTTYDLILLSAASLFLSIKETIVSSNIVKRKNKSAEFSFLRQVSKNRAKQFRKPRKKEKYNRLMNLQSIIFELIDRNGYSYRDVSKFLFKYYKFKVSHTTIGSFYRKFKKEPENV